MTAKYMYMYNDSADKGLLQWCASLVESENGRNKSRVNEIFNLNVQCAIKYVEYLYH